MIEAKTLSIQEAAKNLRAAMRENADIEARVDSVNEVRGGLMRELEASNERIFGAKCALVDAALEDPGEA